MQHRSITSQPKQEAYKTHDYVQCTSSRELLRPKLTSPFFNVHVCLGSGRDSPSLKLPYMSRAEAVKPWQPGQRLSVRNWTINLPSQHKTPSPSEPRQDFLVMAGRCYSTYLSRLLKPRWWISCYICRTTWQIIKNYSKHIKHTPQTAGEFKNIICPQKIIF